MKQWLGAAVAVMLAAGALSAGLASAATQVLGPEGRAYSVETADGRYNAQFRRGGRYEDSRGANGSWNFDGRTVCMIVRVPREGEYEACAPFSDLRIGQSIMTQAWTPDGALARVTRVE